MDRLRSYSYLTVEEISSVIAQADEAAAIIAEMDGDDT